MQDTDPEFFGQVALLAEAGRINPIFASKMLGATTEAEVDAMVEQAKDIVDGDADQAWI